MGTTKLQTQAQAPEPSLQLTLIGRAYCHLCDDMQAALARLLQARGIAYELESVDLDAHPSLEDRFGALIPVLLVGRGSDGVEICHHFLNEAALLGCMSPTPTT